MFKRGDQYEIETITCPFNPAHFMPKSSFLRHIQKCKSVNKTQFKQCPYDVYHIIKKQHFNIHLENCPSNQFHQEKIQQNDWECGIYDDYSYQDSQTINNWQNQNVLTQSLIEKKNINFSSKIHQSQLLKQFQNMKIEQDSDYQQFEYWNDFGNTEKSNIHYECSIPHKLSRKSNRSNHSQIIKFEKFQPAYFSQASIKVQIGRRQFLQYQEDANASKKSKNVHQKRNIRKAVQNSIHQCSKRPQKFCARLGHPQFTGNLQCNDRDQFAEELSNYDFQNIQKYSRLNHKLYLSQPYTLELPRHMKYHKQRFGSDGQAFNSFEIKNQSLQYGSKLHNLSLTQLKQKKFFSDGIDQLDNKIDQSHQKKSFKKQKKADKQKKQKKERHEQQKTQKSRELKQKTQRKKKQ